MPVLRDGALAVVAVLTLVTSDKPTATWMSEQALQSAFAGQAIDGHYSNGKAFTESYGRDGRIEYREPGLTHRGHWSVQAGAFCTIYDSDPTGGCYRVRQVGANCYEFYFVARTEIEATRPGPPSWTARGWLNSQPATCKDGATV